MFYSNSRNSYSNSCHVSRCLFWHACMYPPARPVPSVRYKVLPIRLCSGFCVCTFPWNECLSRDTHEMITFLHLFFQFFDSFSIGSVRSICAQIIIVMYVRHLYSFDCTMCMDTDREWVMDVSISQSNSENAKSKTTKIENNLRFAICGENRFPFKVANWQRFVLWVGGFLFIRKNVLTSTRAPGMHNDWEGERERDKSGLFTAGLDFVTDFSLASRRTIIAGPIFERYCSSMVATEIC